MMAHGVVLHFLSGLIYMGYLDVSSFAFIGVFGSSFPFMTISFWDYGITRLSFEFLLCNTYSLRNGI